MAPTQPLHVLLEQTGWIQALAARLVADPHLAADLAQDTTLDALRQAPDGSRPLRGWLATVMRHNLSNLRRGERHRAAREASVRGDGLAPATLDVVEKAETHRNVVQAVLALEEPYRSTLLMRFFEQLPYEEIARRLGLTRAAVNSRISRGLAQLRERLESQYGGDRRALCLALGPLARGPADLVNHALWGVKTLFLVIGSAAATLLAVTFSMGGWGGAGAPEAVSEPLLDPLSRGAPGQPSAPAAALEPAAAERHAPVGASGLAVDRPSGPADPVPEGALLAAVPENAFSLVHVADPAGLRFRAEHNDWVALCTSPDGEPALQALEREYEAATGTEFGGLLEVALRLQGEALLFFTGEVAGFLTEPPPDRSALAAALDGWLTEPRRTLEVAGGRVQIAAWPQDPERTRDRTGHFLALLDHPLALGLYSGDSADAVLAALTDSLGGLRSGRRAGVVESFLAAGGGANPGIEAFVDFTPFVPVAEQTLREALEGLLPDPTGLLGLEQGTGLFVSADVLPGTQVELRARLSLPPGTLAAQLADSFEPLPSALAAELPRGTWAVGALDWNLARFYATARAGLEGVDADGLQVVDQGLATAKAISRIDLVEGVLNQLTGLFAWFHVVDPDGPPSTVEEGIGFLAGLIEEHEFLDAFEALLEVGRIGVDPVELEGAETYLLGAERIGSDGGLSILPRQLLLSPGRATLVRGLQALNHGEGAGLPAGSALRQAFDENAGACAFAHAQLARLRALALPELGPLPAGHDPFDSQLTIATQRTASGFECRLYTR